MRWWCRNRHVGGSCLATILLAAAVTAVGDTQLAAPLSLSVACPAALLLPLAVVIVIAWSRDGQAARVEAQAVRRAPQVADAAFALGLTVLWLVVVRLLPVHHGLMAPAARNLLGSVGLTLISLRLVAPRWAAVPASLWLFVAITFGNSSTGIRPWAWPVMHDCAIGWWWASALFTLGLIASLLPIVKFLTRQAA